MATSENLIRVLKAMDKGVLDLLLIRYGGAGYLLNNTYLYALTEWYTNAVEADPGFFEAHNNITAGPVIAGVAEFTCECGMEFQLSQDRIANFGTDELIVFHQLDWAWQNMPPKDRPQWWQYQ